MCDSILRHKNTKVKIVFRKTKIAIHLCSNRTWYALRQTHQTMVCHQIDRTPMSQRSSISMSLSCLRGRIMFYAIEINTFMANGAECGKRMVNEAEKYLMQSQNILFQSEKCLFTVN